MARARAIGLFIVAPALVLAASVLGALSATSSASRIIPAVLAVAAGVLIIWGAIYLRRLPKTR